MRLSKAILSTFAAIPLVTSPVVAQAAAPLDRLSTEVEGESLRGGFIIPLLAVVAIILGILAMTGGDGDPPTSP